MSIPSHTEIFRDSYREFPNKVAVSAGVNVTSDIVEAVPCILRCCVHLACKHSLAIFALPRGR